MLDRKSTRLNSSHLGISYAVFCLKKKKKTASRRRVRSNARHPYLRTRLSVVRRASPKRSCGGSAAQLSPLIPSCFFFFFNDTATTEIYTLSLHDALPIFLGKMTPTRVRFGGVSPAVAF